MRTSESLSVKSLSGLFQSKFSLIPKALDKILKNLGTLNYDLSSIYKLWKNPEFKNNIILILKIIYTIDIINTISNLKKNKYWSLPTFNTTNQTKIWDIRNPLLEYQNPNQVSLNKNLIIIPDFPVPKITFLIPQQQLRLSLQNRDAQAN